MKMNKALAQEIADKVMNVIPYNVNIMDEIGLIIGSGDPERMGTYHQGAVSAIEQGTIVSIYESEGASKPGVNIPIHFRDRIIGVIGISGDPNIVGPFAELVRVTAELLINQELLFRERRIQEQMKEEFLYQWVFRSGDYDTAIINNGEALGINLALERKAIVVKGRMPKEPYLLKQEYYFRLNQESMLYVVPNDSDIVKRIEAIQSSNPIRIGVGGRYTLVSKSVEEARRAIEISERIDLPQTICVYQELKFIDYLTNKDISFEEITNFFKELDENPKGQELTETLICYIKNSGDMNAISKELHIHRNSLAYRLQRIEVLTNKNPKNFMDLFQLFTGYILYKMQKQP
ncbi:CdaR family transcriptional regulator [Neobacillus cucumis]|uniref:Sugar diacid recognition protein n=1 Tax=Neobacillus cucumis TaxID=1740721 RepID=A0A2N5HB15_9BACI|nr:sugar diacid recognition domain-containing protein [Neobacillus cucumis]PLS02694.1 sugar diacid recognition protein [Neobacillus cucumis]